MLIYLIKNKINNKVYVGQTTKDINSRWQEHLRDSSCCTYLRRAIKKYGKNNFELIKLCDCSSCEELNEKEIYFIKFYNSFGKDGYNLTSGGKDNFVVSEESKIKKSISLKKSWKVRDNKKPRLGMKNTLESKNKVRETLSGKKHSEIRKMNQSNSRKKLFENGYKQLKFNDKPNSGSFSIGMVAPNKGRKRIIIDGKIRYIKGENLYE